MTGRDRRIALAGLLLCTALARGAGGLLAGDNAAPTAQAPARMDPDPAFLSPGESRTFTVTYRALVKEVPAGTKALRLWLPVPQDAPMQTIKGVDFQGPLAPRITTEKRFGNRLAYYEVANPGATMHLAPDAKTFAWETSMSFTCTRKEQVTDLAKAAGDGTDAEPAPEAFRKDDRLTIVDDRIRKMAAEVAGGRKTTLEKARAIYDFVAGKMTYDKSGTGWGRGDTNYACDAGVGNCTDFHALFMSLCRAEGIAAGFEIGLYAPYKRNSEEKPGGYHCWAFFRVPGKTWVPVDISEADRNPDRMDYFFGAHTSNRVTMSVGRDLVLEPPQAGEPLNFMINPCAEADGKPLAAEKSWTMKDLE